jgi:hypothetical protein
MRIDDPNFRNILPSASASASVPPTGGMPGIIFSGPESSGPSFGLGQASQDPFNWQVMGDLFTTTHGLVPTSYTFLLQTAIKAGVLKSTAQAFPALNSATAHGVYRIDQSISINAVPNFRQGDDFIILIDGDLTINREITVPPGTTVIFSAKGDIIVSEDVGLIEGLYSADGSFIVQGVGNCPGTRDIPLNIEGTVVANAGRHGGGAGTTFINGRTLCAGNSTTPVITFTERPDFLINYPEIVKTTTKVWQEIAP